MTLTNIEMAALGGKARWRGVSKKKRAEIMLKLNKLSHKNRKKKS